MSSPRDQFQGSGGDDPKKDSKDERILQEAGGDGGEANQPNEERSPDAASEVKDTSSRNNKDKNNNNKGLPEDETISGKKDEKPSGGIDHTPLPDASPGFTVKFTFHRATNLPPADIATASCDPFLTATLRTSAPKRHKQDPDLIFRTPTLRKTTDPEWNAEWTVANVPSSSFTIKCRLYDEDYPDHDDRLGNATIKVEKISEDWEGYPPPGKEFLVKKRMGSKRAYGLKAIASMLSPGVHMTPTLHVSIEVLGKSGPPHAMVYTVGPSFWIKHFSSMIGRIAGTKVHKDEVKDSQQSNGKDENEKKTKKYDFQANEMQLSGPIPSTLYHRYVAFRPIIKGIFSSSGLRGKILNKALHSQHSKVYNFNRTTERGEFKPCSEDASLTLLRMAHFDEGGRVFTYVLTLDSLFRFTETGGEFGIDLLSKHTMHSDVAAYIACSGEFFVRRLEKADASNEAEPDEATHPSESIPGGPPYDSPPPNPRYYQLIIDNDSGTYRPDKAILPDLRAFMEKNFPGIGIVALHWEDKELQKLKEAQHKAKKKEGRTVPLVLRSVSSSSMSSDESRLDGLERRNKAGSGLRIGKETALELVEDPSKLRNLIPIKRREGDSSAPLVTAENG